MAVTRTARLTGAGLCAALAFLVVVRPLRDLAVLGPTAEPLRQWLGEGGSPGRGVAATSLVDPLLLVACTVTAVIAPRSRFAGPAFTGLITLALRLPGLWIADADALVTTLLTLALATGLVLTAIAGRGPDGTGAPRPGPGRRTWRSSRFRATPM
ncbi:hypothetical protein ACGFRB_03745 [Streptomyces sp. NPDC048718]|uniref:hypothetical protein n=1 Tax=Streptomyces sp. NPDC048718 TaxID=3365587 RepID=UPI00371A292F